LAAQLKRDPRPGLLGWWLGRTLSNACRSGDHI
jgi:hypothetical protein